MINLKDKRDGEFQNENNVWFTFNYISPLEAGELHPRDWEEVNAKIDMSDGTFRYAKLLKTCVFVAVDEDENGLLVFERWKIKKINHWEN